MITVEMLASSYWKIIDSPNGSCKWASLHIAGLTTQTATSSMDTGEAGKHSQHEAAPTGRRQPVSFPEVAGIPAISVAKSWVAARLLSRMQN